MINEDAAFVISQMDDSTGILVLVQGTLKDGSSHYAYASILPSRYAEFKKAQEAGGYDLAEYGTVIAHGPGESPPPEIQQQMQDTFGASMALEEELASWKPLIKDNDTQ